MGLKDHFAPTLPPHVFGDDRDPCGGEEVKGDLDVLHSQLVSSVPEGPDNGGSAEHLGLEVPLLTPKGEEIRDEALHGHVSKPG
jgi:hypothetical protein